MEVIAAPLGSRLARSRSTVGIEEPTTGSTLPVTLGRRSRNLPQRREKVGALIHGRTVLNREDGLKLWLLDATGEGIEAKRRWIKHRSLRSLLSAWRAVFRKASIPPTRCGRRCFEAMT